METAFSAPLAPLADRLAEAKQRFSTATAEALRGDDSAWARAEIFCRQVQSLLGQIERERQADERAA